ncbi:uncharacterized protein BROUX77_000497 [Berkeleyomyces rouxiae]|uniref:uncharacterized protein n=1 Tax=Berkeleyomyces rouxiae TaxID=2035830 RepID=UPI003B7C3A7B
MPATWPRAISKLRRQSSTPSPTTDPEKDTPAATASVTARTGPTPFSIHSTRRKRAIVLAASLAAFFSPMTQQIYLPALPALAARFNVSDSAMTLTVTSYMIFQGITPMFVGGFADRAGRRPAYLACFTVYVAANLALARAQSYAALLGLRCLQAAGSSGTVALAYAVVADVVTPAERGAYIGFTAVPVVLAPALGPVLGGVLSEYLGWRWIFWYLAIFAGAMLLALFLFFPETCRVLVGNGSRAPPRLNRTGLALLKEWLARRKVSGEAPSPAPPPPRAQLYLPNPLPSIRILVEKELGLLLLTSSLVFSGFYSVSAALPSLFRTQYRLSELQISLMFLPLAGGSIAAAALVGPLLNWNYRRHGAHLADAPAHQPNGVLARAFPIERARLQIGLPLLFVAAAATAAWGWAMHAAAPLAVPCVLLVVLGAGLVGYNNTSNALLVDVNGGRAAAATAANNLARCLVGAGATAAIVPLVEGIGAGWAFTLVGFMYVAAVPLALVIMRYGMRWRGEELEKKDAQIVR